MLTIALQVKIAIWASLVANFTLVILQRATLSSPLSTPADASTTVYAAISSASLSLLATGIDATFDFGSNVMLYYLHRKANSLDVDKWPVGGARLETIGNIVYGKSHAL